MNENSRKIIKFTAGILGAIALIAASVLTSIYAPHLAMIIDPFMIALSLACIGMSAHAIGYKLGGVFIERKTEQKTTDCYVQHVHLHHHFDNDDKQTQKSNELAPLDNSRNNSKQKIRMSHKLPFFKKHSNNNNYTYNNDTPTNKN